MKKPLGSVNKLCNRSFCKTAFFALVAGVLFMCLHVSALQVRACSYGECSYKCNCTSCNPYDCNCKTVDGVKTCSTCYKTCCETCYYCKSHCDLCGATACSLGSSHYTDSDCDGIMNCIDKTNTDTDGDGKNDCETCKLNPKIPYTHTRYGYRTTSLCSDCTDDGTESDGDAKPDRCELCDTMPASGDGCPKLQINIDDKTPVYWPGDTAPSYTVKLESYTNYGETWWKYSPYGNYTTTLSGNTCSPSYSKTNTPKDSHPGTGFINCINGSTNGYS
ncbi:MAG: hypothetical protein V1753_10590, partial [Pseudomonadota bacterium]